MQQKRSTSEIHNIFMSHLSHLLQQQNVEKLYVYHGIYDNIHRECSQTLLMEKLLGILMSNIFLYVHIWNKYL